MILVTGTRGLLGATLLRRLAEAVESCLPFEGDVAKREDAEAYAARLGTGDWIIHAAAMTDVGRCEREREACHRANVEGTREIRDLAARTGARLAYISTVSVFDGETGGYVESDPPSPKNWYNQTKHAGELLAADAQGSLIIRLNLIGIHPDGSRGKNFLEWLLDSALQDKDMKLFADIRINPLCNWTAADAVIGLIRRADLPRIVHLGSRDIVSKAEIGKMVIARVPSYAGKAEEIMSDDAKRDAHRPKEMWLDTRLARETLGLRLPSVAEEIETVFSHLSS